MLRSKLLELASTRFLVHTVIGTVLAIVGAFAAILAFGLTDLEHLSKFTDAVFKAVALGVATLWALNRYFVERTDAPQFRVDSDVSKVPVPGGADLSLLIFRLDLVNTGKTQIPQYKQFVQVHAVDIEEGSVSLDPLYRWPASGWHRGGSIEPGSWAAINDEICCPATVAAVRLYIAVVVSDESQWDWHKTFDVSGNGTHHTAT